MKSMIENSSLVLRKSNQGYTLVELMIVISIVAILSGVSMTYYGDYIKAGHRAEAKSTLLQLANVMERYKTENNSYDPSGASPRNASTLAPTIFATQSPTSGTAIYDLTISVLTASTYTLVATPVSSEVMSGDGALTLTHTGAKTYQGVTGWP